MISDNAKAALNQWFIRALESSFGPQYDGSCVVELVPADAPTHGTRAVMLTMSSYTFRVFTVIYFTPDPTTLAYFSSRVGADAEGMTEQLFDDAICESANMCCGALNRELGQVYDHIGLSTPNILDARSADHLAQLRSGHLQKFRLLHNGVALFHAGICVCDFVDMDFSAAAVAAQSSAADSVESGELELF